MNKNGYKPFDSYVGSTTLPSGAIPKNPKYPFIVQSSNVQIDEEGHSLYDYIEEQKNSGGGTGGSGDDINDTIPSLPEWSNLPVVKAHLNDTATGYTATFGIEKYYSDGDKISFIMVTDKACVSTTPTLYITNLRNIGEDAGYIKRRGSFYLDEYHDVPADFFKAGGRYRIEYDGLETGYWILADYPEDETEEIPTVRVTSVNLAGSEYYYFLRREVNIDKGFSISIIMSETNSVRTPTFSLRTNSGNYSGDLEIKRVDENNANKYYEIPEGFFVVGEEYKLTYDGKWWVLADYPVIDNDTGYLETARCNGRTTSKGFVYTGSINKPATNLTKGYTFILRVLAKNSAAHTFLRLLTAYPVAEIEIKRPLSEETEPPQYFDVPAGFLNPDVPYVLRYDGTYWILVNYPAVVDTGSSGTPNLSISVKDKVLQLHVRQ